MATTLTKPIGTVTLTGAVEEVELPSNYEWIWIRNFSDGNILAGISADISEGADGVMIIPAGDAGRIQADGFKSIYLLGTGSAMVIGQNYADCPFKTGAKGGDVQASGNPVTLNGLQGGVPFSEMVVNGKNLCDYPYFSGESHTFNGVVFTDNHDGSVTANGTATNGIGMYGIWDNAYPKTLPTGTYTISGCPKQGNDDIRYQVIVGTLTSRLATDNGNGATFTLDEPTAIVMRIYILTGKTADNVTFYPQLELGDTVTAYEPPITGRELQVNVCGKNLITYPYYTPPKTINGVDITINDDKSITFNGTATATGYFVLLSSSANAIKIHSGTNLAFNFVGETSDIGLYGAVELRYNDNISTVHKRFTQGVNNNFMPLNVTVGEGTEYITVYLSFHKGAVFDNYTAYPQLEIGSTATPYEPYHGSTTTITPDSNPYIIPNDIRQADGLNNISVSEGEISVVGVRKNAAIKNIWDRIDELTTAIIVSNGESE